MTRLALTLVTAVVVAAAPIAAADPGRPPALAGVRVDEHVGDRLPLDLWFSDAAGRRIQLHELFDGERPVLLVLGYVRCQMLCSLVLHGVTDAVRAMPLTLGRGYRVVTVSIDPHEDAATAAARRTELLSRVGRPDATDGWTYLVGADRPIRALADALGFHYVWDGKTEQYAHPAVVFVITPDGTIARYVHGVDYAATELAASLRAAAAGFVFAPSVAESVLSCFRFDPAVRAHRDAIESYLRIGGLAVSLALGSSVLLLFLWERRRRRSP